MLSEEQCNDLEEPKWGDDVIDLCPARLTVQDYTGSIRGELERKAQCTDSSRDPAPHASPWLLGLSAIFFQGLLSTGLLLLGPGMPLSGLCPTSCQPILEVLGCLSRKSTGDYATKEEAELFHLPLSLNNAH